MTGAAHRAVNLRDWRCDFKIWRLTNKMGIFTLTKTNKRRVTKSSKPKIYAINQRKLYKLKTK